MNKAIIVALVGATVLAGGCGTMLREVERLAVQPSPSVGTPTSVTSSPARAPGAADLARAAQAALGAVPGSTLTSIEAEEHGHVWEVEVVSQDGTEHQMDVRDGKVVSGPTPEDDDARDKAERRKLLSAAKFDYARAAAKITAAVPEGRITELSLDTERGRTVWEADVRTPDGTKHEVAVDAATGEITRNNGTRT